MIYFKEDAWLGADCDNCLIVRSNNNDTCKNCMSKYK